MQIEETRINELINTFNTKKYTVVVYGRNTCDDTAYKKYRQICSLGFTEVYVYSGGLFEWLLLQDIYGKDNFPTSKPAADILQHRPAPLFSAKRISW
jgi:hypothetical protein